MWRKLARLQSGCTISARTAGGPACGPVAPATRPQRFAETVGDARQQGTTPEDSEWPWQRLDGSHKDSQQ